MYRYYMRKSDPEEPPKLEEPLDERDSRLKRLKDQKQGEQDTDEKMLEEKFYRYFFLFHFVVQTACHKILVSATSPPFKGCSPLAASF